MVTMRHLLKCDALSGDKHLPITEIFFDAARGGVGYVALSGLHETDEALVAISSFDDPLPDEGIWPVRVDDDALARAPHWHAPGHEAMPFAIESWPPLLVGPFGSTTSPLMFAAQFEVARDAGEAGPDDPTMARTQETLERFERATQRLGAEVFGRDGQLGELDDIELDEHGRKLVALSVKGENSAVLPYAALRHMAQDGTHVVLSLTGDDLRGAAR